MTVVYLHGKSEEPEKDVSTEAPTDVAIGRPLQDVAKVMDELKDVISHPSITIDELL